MAGHPVLDTARLRLRTWRQDEIARITTARTNQATAHFLPFIPQPFTAEDARFWLKDMAEQAVAGKRFNWCVADAGTDQGLGNITLFGIQVEGAEIGYWMHPEAQGRGVMSEAIQRVSQWYFAPAPDSGFGGKRLVIRTAGTNAAARRTAENAGFRLFGTKPAAFPISTHHDDEVTYELLATDQIGRSGARPSST